MLCLWPGYVRQTRCVPSSTCLWLQATLAEWLMYAGVILPKGQLCLGHVGTTLACGLEAPLSYVSVALHEIARLGDEQQLNLDFLHQPRSHCISLGNNLSGNMHSNLSSHDTGHWRTGHRLYHLLHVYLLLAHLITVLHMMSRCFTCLWWQYCEVTEREPFSITDLCRITSSSI